MQILKLREIRPEQLEFWHFYKQQSSSLIFTRQVFQIAYVCLSAFPRLLLLLKVQTYVAQTNFFKVVFLQQIKRFTFDKMKVYSQLNSYLTLAY